MSTIGSRLKKARKEVGISQEAFAAFAGVGKRAQINYEQDLRVPDADYLARIAAAEVDVLYILTGQRKASVKSPCRTTASIDPDGVSHPLAPVMAVLQRLDAIRVEQVRAATLLEQIHDYLTRPSVPLHARREASPEESPALRPLADGGA